MGSYDPIEYQNLIRAVAAQLQYVPELLNNNEMNDIIVSLNELAGVAYTKDLIQVAKMLEPVIVARDFVSHMPELTARFLYLFIYRLNLNGVITAAQDALLADATRASSPVIFNCLSRTNMLPKTVLGHVVYELKTLGIPAAWNEKALITGLNVLSQEGLKAKDRMRPEGIPVFLEGICVGGLRKLPVWAVTMLASTLASMRTHDDGVVRLLSHNIVKHRWVQFGVRDAAQIVESYTRLGLWYGEARVLMRGLEQDIDSMSFKDATALRLQWMIRGACAAASTVHLYDKLSNILTKYLHERGVYDLTALCVSYKHLAEVGYEGPNMDVLRTRIIKGLSDENLEHPRTRIFHFAGALSALDDKNPDMWHFIESLLVKHNMAENLDVIKSACFMQYFAKAGFAPHTFAQQLDEHFMKQGVSLTLNRFTATVFKECFVALPLDYPQFLMNRINAPDQRTLNDVSGVHLQKMKPYLFTMNRFKGMAGLGQEADKSPTEYVTLVSAEGYEFIIEKKAAELSKMLKEMMLGSETVGISINRFPFDDISAPVLDMLCQYLAERHRTGSSMSEFIPLRNLDVKSEEDKQIMCCSLLTSSSVITGSAQVEERNADAQGDEQAANCTSAESWLPGTSRLGLSCTPHALRTRRGTQKKLQLGRGAL